MLKHIFILSFLTLSGFNTANAQRSPALAMVYEQDIFWTYGPPVDYIGEKGYILRWVTFDAMPQFDFSTVDGVIITHDSHVYPEQDSNKYDPIIESGKKVMSSSPLMSPFGFGTSTGLTSYGTEIEIVDNTHEITAGFSLGPLPISQGMSYRNYIDPAPDVSVLAAISEGTIIAARGDFIYFGILFGDSITATGYELFGNCLDFLWPMPAFIRRSPEGSQPSGMPGAYTLFMPILDTQRDKNMPAIGVDFMGRKVRGPLNSKFIGRIIIRKSGP